MNTAHLGEEPLGTESEGRRDQERRQRRGTEMKIRVEVGWSEELGAAGGGKSQAIRAPGKGSVCRELWPRC